MIEPGGLISSGCYRFAHDDGLDSCTVREIRQYSENIPKQFSSSRPPSCISQVKPISESSFIYEVITTPHSGPRMGCQRWAVQVTPDIANC